MRDLKIALIGSGSTYSPELIHGFLTREDKMRVREFALMDITPERLEIVGGLIKRMCTNFKVQPEVNFYSELEPAISGADYVVTQFRVGLLPARVKDEGIPQKFGILGQETTGPGGFAKALRTIPKVLEVAKCMEKCAPNAVLVNFTNPSGIITEAVTKYSKVKVVGLCNTPITTFKKINEVMGFREEDVFYDFFGLNHFGMIRDIYLNGRKVSEEYFEKIMNHERMPEMLGFKFNKAYVKAAGFLPVQYMQYYLHTREKTQELCSLERTRAQVLLEVDKELLVQYSDPELKTKPKGLDQRGGAWYSEAAVALMTSIETNDGNTHIINCRNNGTILDLPEDCVIEVPAVVRGESIKPLSVGRLPRAIAGTVQHVKAYESLTVEAGAEHDRQKALLALCAHPFITSVNDAEQLLDQIIAAHPDYIDLR